MRKNRNLIRPSSQCLLLVLILIVTAVKVSGQSNDSLQQFLKSPPRAVKKIDSLKQLLLVSRPDSNKVNLLLMISRHYYFNRPDTCLIYSDQAITLARDLEYYPGLVLALRTSGEMLRMLGDYPGALKHQFEALEINKKKNYEDEAQLNLNFIGLTYIEFHDYRKGLTYLFEATLILVACS